MTRVLLLATNDLLTQRVGDLPDHVVSLLDREMIDRLSRLAASGCILGAPSDDTPDVVVLGDGMAVSEALTHAESISSSCPDVALVLVGEPDADLVFRAMRAGVKDIIPATASQDDLKVLLHRFERVAGQRHVSVSDDENPPAVERSRVVVVTGPKGGVGRSTIASNVAVALAKVAPMETVLVDLDLHFGDASMVLDLAPQYSIADAFESAGSRDSLILKSFLTPHASGFYVLCGAPAPTVADQVTEAGVASLLAQLASQFRHVVVDTSARLDGFTMAAIRQASDLVLVSTMDVASARALRKQITVLAAGGISPEARHVVLNAADRSSGINVRGIESEIGRPVDVVLPRSLDVSVAVNLGESVMARRGGGSFRKGINLLVNRIQDEHADAPSKHRGVEVA